MTEKEVIEPLERPMKLDRSRWEGCDNCTAGDGIFRILLDKWGDGGYCSRCGRPLTVEAWAEMEKKACGALPDHIRELLLAEKEGRLVVLPCKREDILWTFCAYPKAEVYSFSVRDLSTLNGRTMLNTDRLSVIPASDVGKTVFLTRAEAEAELERRIGENDEKTD